MSRIQDMTGASIIACLLFIGLFPPSFLLYGFLPVWTGTNLVCMFIFLVCLLACWGIVLLWSGGS